MRAEVIRFFANCPTLCLDQHSTVMTTGGPVGGVLMSGLTGGTFEDLLMLTIGGLAAYVSVINLPLKCVLRDEG